ncbi:ABC transporter substrate-binding protein [Alteromonas oceanisediminis]|uniref:ABC transporter substrate-binding protein n=1 Tax=Alteromonas oceanisediminis TaxID=2836180 RepID=UPI001BDB60B5|nr:ABC transporter substrate-binding protein [Alteromonas oceanisediminis]MBT0585170.1 hypothetical protein [Alteromonas oceanisediminis]
MRVIVVFVLLSLSACSSENESIKPRDGNSQIVVALRNDVRGFEPGISRDVFTDDLFLHIYEGLVTYDEKGGVIPLLAESVNISENGLTYEFTLREKVVFHNDKPLNSEVVKKHYERILDPDGTWLCRSWYDGSRGLEIIELEAPDDKTFVMTLNTPDASFLDKLANVQCGGYIVHPDSFDQDGNFIEPIGTGPYALSQWQKGEFVSLEAFTQYRSSGAQKDGLGGAKRALVDKIKWQIIPDISSSIAGLLSGQIDMAGRLDATSLYDVINETNLEVHKQQSFDWNTLLFQTKDPLLSDLALRQAIASALDINSIAQSVSGGISKQNPSVVSTQSRYYSDCHTAGYTFDKSKAKQFLQQSRYVGQAISLITNKRYNHMYDNALLIHFMLTQAGFNVELEVVEWSTQVDLYLTGNFQLMVFGYSGRTDPLLAYEAILGDKSQHPYYQWENDKARGLLNQSMREISAEQRKETFCEVHKLMIQDIPLINLHNQYIIDVTTPSLIDYAPYTLQTPRFWGVKKEEGRRQ